MFHKFNAKEIFEMAEQLERNGYEFYQKAADAAKDEDIKKFLLGLAEMEVTHEKIFADMKKELTAKEKEDAVFDPYDETAAYIQALVDTRVFYEREIDMSSVEEVLKEAISAEKESIVFYLGMKEMVPQEQGKHRLDNIIREEMGHIQVITAQLLNWKK